MKKFTLVSLVAAAAFATTAAFSASNVFADDTTTGDTTPGKTTEGTISLTAGKDNTGKITLDKAPSVDFGTQVLSSTAAHYTADSVSDDLQVTNPGIASGWLVQAQASKFATTDKVELKGAVLKLNNPAASISDPDSNQSKVATASSLDFTNTDTNVDAFKADSAATGVGVNTAKYDKANATLDVPAGNIKGAYTATITWTLTDSAN